MTVPVNKKVNPQLQIVCNDFFTTIRSYHKDIPKQQIDALYKAIITFIFDIIITERMVDYFATYGISSKKGQKLSNMIFHWAKGLDENLINHPQFKGVFNRLCVALCVQPNEQKALMIPTSIPQKIPVDTPKISAVVETSPSEKPGHQAVPRAKREKPTYTNTAYSGTGYFQGTARSNGYGGIAWNIIKLNSTGDILDEIRTEINRYDSSVGFSGYETWSAKQSISNIIRLADKLKEKHETKHTQCKTCCFETEHCQQCADKPTFTIFEIKDAFMEEKVAILNATDITNHLVTSETKYKIEIQETIHTHKVYYWHARNIHSGWISTNIYLSSAMLKTWEEEKKKKNKICNTCNKIIVGTQYLKTQDDRTIYQCSGCALASRKQLDTKATSIYG